MGLRGRHRRSRGFTIVEVLLVVVIVAVLTGIALPAYRDSVTKARRSDAKTALLAVSNRQESHMMDRSTYTENMVDLGFGVDPMISEEGYYRVDAAPCAGGSIGSCYVLTATPLAGEAQAGDTRCTNFILDSNGARSANGSAAAECW